jgi:adenylate cyclase
MVRAHSSDGSASSRRRLAAVVFADVVGYSILMARDEERTHNSWMALLSDVVRPYAVEHGGRIVKSTGDGVLAEFPSALDAVEWGQAVQSAAIARSNQAERDADNAPTIALRLGVHLSDVIVTDDDDIHGNGVNVAARLQEHAEPGGIVLSATTLELVRGSLAAPARDLGLIQLKNFDLPIHAYALDPPIARRLRVPAIPNAGPLPSIAVLPFRAVGAEGLDDYFGDGLVEDIIISLSGLHELMVIARSSTVKYRHQEPDVREVGRALGVRYVMTGGIRRSLNRVRVSMHLFDAQSGTSLWGDTTDAALGDLFEVQDQIVRRIVAGIAPHVRAEEMRRALRKRPESFNAYDHTLRALDVMSKLDRATFGQAIGYLSQAMIEDPGFAMAAAWAARWHSINIGQGWSTDPDRDSEQALLLATRAIELDPNNALALATYGHLKSRLFRDFDAALMYFDRALAACPSNSLAWSLSALTLAYVGQADGAVRHAEHALRLSPLDNAISFYYTNLGYAHYAADNLPEAVKWTRMAAGENPMFTANLRLLAAALAGLDRRDEASRVAAAIVAQEPNFSLAQYEAKRQPFRDPEVARRLMARLRLSGLPE